MKTIIIIIIYHLFPCVVLTVTVIIITNVITKSHFIKNNNFYINII